MDKSVLLPCRFNGLAYEGNRCGHPFTGVYCPPVGEDRREIANFLKVHILPDRNDAAERRALSRKETTKLCLRPLFGEERLAEHDHSEIAGSQAGRNALENARVWYAQDSLSPWGAH